LGDQVAGEIASKPSEYPILPEKEMKKYMVISVGLPTPLFKAEVSNIAVNLIGRHTLSKTTRRSMLFVHREAKYMYIPD
jgi:energy-converting hydrogenase Eha subunit A